MPTACVDPTLGNGVREFNSIGENSVQLCIGLQIHVHPLSRDVPFEQGNIDQMSILSLRRRPKLSTLGQRLVFAGMCLTYM